MKLSDRGIAELFSHEAIVLSPYKDSVGVWTIFVGHTAGAGAPDPAKMPKGVERPMSEAIATFRRDIVKYEAAVSKAVHVTLKQHQYDALVSFHYNTGAIGKASFVKKLNAGDFAGAAKGMMDWDKPPEIIPRRQKEQLLFRTGEYSSDGRCTVYPADAQGRVQWNKGRRVNVAMLLGTAPVVEPVSPPPQPDDPGPVAPAEKPAGTGTAGKVVAGGGVAGGAAVAYAGGGLTGLFVFLGVVAVIGGLAAFVVRWRK